MLWQRGGGKFDSVTDPQRQTHGRLYGSYNYE